MKDNFYLFLLVYCNVASFLKYYNYFFGRFYDSGTYLHIINTKKTVQGLKQIIEHAGY